MPPQKVKLQEREGLKRLLNLEGQTVEDPTDRKPLALPLLLSADVHPIPVFL